MANELRIGPMDPNEKTDPADPETAAAFTGRYGVQNNARRLIDAMADAYPPDLVAAGGLPVDEERTETLDTEELQKAVPSGTVVGAKVRGSRPDSLVVVYTVRADEPEGAPPGSGRTSRGRLPYLDLKKSQKAYKNEHDRKLGVGAAARSAGAKDDEQGDQPEDPRVAPLQEEVNRLREQLAEADQPVPPEESTHNPVAGQAAPATADQSEPWKGYDEQNTEEIRDHLAQVPDDEYQDLRARVHEYEGASEKPRKGVLDATKPSG